MKLLLVGREVVVFCVTFLALTLPVECQNKILMSRVNLNCAAAAMLPG